jgi:hypothetical protein
MNVKCKNNILKKFEDDCEYCGFMHEPQLLENEYIEYEDVEDDDSYNQGQHHKKKKKKKIKKKKNKEKRDNFIANLYDKVNGFQRIYNLKKNDILCLEYNPLDSGSISVYINSEFIVKSSNTMKCFYCIQRKFK